MGLLREIKQLKKAIKKGDENPFLYKTEELIYMKKQLRMYRHLNAIDKISSKKGFGNQLEKYIEAISEINQRDSRSGEDDGVHSEGEQSIESGESECSGTTEVLHQE